MAEVEIRTEFPRTPMVWEDIWIPLVDGTRLHGRVWLPEDAEQDPVPAVLEYGPYRLTDGTVLSDAQQMRWFAGYGYAGIRVDIRGTGESDGLCTDEYTEQEILDGVEVVEWIATQSWCTGAVGMMGYSWTGFNSLQIAARRPPSLKAIATGYSTDDRYADDVHFKGGLIDALDMAHWSVCMHAWQARPPVPARVGERWRELWLERLELEPWIAHWLAHQRRDDYWRHGSVSEDLSKIEIPVLAIAGWTDGYTDSAFRLLAGLSGPRKAIIGPWGHVDPIHGPPTPQVGILSELVRWWDRWLKNIDSGIDDDPLLIAYQQDPVAPAGLIPHRPGRWIGEQTWPSLRISEHTLYLGDGLLTEQAPSDGVTSVDSVQTVGLHGGSWCADGKSPDLPIDQRREEALSATFTSEPLPGDIAILGHAEARLVLTADQPVAMVSVRVSEILPNGASLLVTRGQLNLTHRHSHAEPVSVVPGEEMTIRLRLDSIAHCFRAGNRIRVAISPCYWPHAWPSPVPVRLGIRRGGHSSLVLPVRPPSELDTAMRPLDPPAEPATPNYTQLASGSGGARVTSVDQQTLRTTLAFDWDMGGAVQYENAVIWEDTSYSTLSITEGDPLSAEVIVENTSRFEHDDLRVDITAKHTMTSNETNYLISCLLDVRENGIRRFNRTWDYSFPRDHN